MLTEADDAHGCSSILATKLSKKSAISCSSCTVGGELFVILTESSATGVARLGLTWVDD